TDIEVGIECAYDRVTLDHRAPEYIMSKTYNSSADIWAFGIMMLYVLGNTPIFNVDFSKITNMEFYELQCQVFADNSHLVDILLENTKDEYRDLCVDLIKKMLRLNSSNRISAGEIVDHPLFNDFRIASYGKGYVRNPYIPYDYKVGHRNVLKL